jgi:hypothetical protein
LQVSGRGTPLEGFIMRVTPLPDFRQTRFSRQWRGGTMSSRILAGVCLFALALSAVPNATSGHETARARQWAVVYLAEPTLVGSTVIQGPVLFEHDGEKMARGEPCTTIRLFDPEKGPVEELVSFHCIPKPRSAVTRFTMTTRPNLELGFGCILTEYQFAGDSEGHGVPASTKVNTH